MLNVMRKYAGSWMIKVLLAAIVLVFIFWGVGSFKSTQKTQVATVNGDIITVDEYQKAYNNIIESYRRQFGDKMNDEMLKYLQLGRQAVDQLVNQKLLLQESEKLGFQVTDRELADRIMSTPAFQSDGVFNKRQYTSLLNQNRLSVDEFEQGFRNQLIIEKLQQFIGNSAKVSEDEAWNWYSYENRMVSIEYVSIKPDSYKDIKLSDEDCKSYFDKNKEKYRVESKMKVQYLEFDPKNFESAVAVPDEEVREYYDTHPEEFHKEKSVAARHILFKLDKKADEKTQQEVKQRALNVLELARKGDDFAELAKKYSEGPSKDAGGALGAFTRGSMVKPFSDAAFALKAGEISDLVKTQFGWHIIKVEKVNPEVTETLENAKAKIKTELIEARSKSAAYDKAEDIYNLLYSGEDISKVAKAQNLEVKKTDFFGRVGPHQQVKSAVQFSTASFELKIMDVSEVKEFEGTYYIIQPLEKTPSKLPEYKDVEARVRTDMTAQKQEEQAENDAKSIIEAVKKDDNFSAASESIGLKVKETAFFRRDGEIPGIGYEPSIIDAAFGLNEKNKLFKDVIRGNDGFFVIRLKEQKEADVKAFEKEKLDLQTRLIQQKKESMFNVYLTEIKKRSQITVQEKFNQ